MGVGNSVYSGWPKVTLHFNGNMNSYFVLLVCVVAVNAQSRGPPPAPPSGSTGTVSASAMPTSDPNMQESPVVTIPATGGVPTSPAVSPPRPKGCSPGCGPKDICAELGMSYCRPGQSCSVCIKMDSIRFPASAVYSMFQPKPAVQPAPVPYTMPSQIPAQQSTADLITQMQNQQRLLTQQQQPQQQLPQTSAFSYTPPVQQQPANQFDMFGFPIQQQQSNSFNSMFPFLWMDGFGMGLGF